MKHLSLVYYTFALLFAASSVFAQVQVVIKEDGQSKTVTMKRNYDNNNYEFQDGMARVEFNGKTGFINERYEEVVPPIYRMARDFREGRAAVANSKYLWTYIDKTGRQLTQPIYNEAFDFFEGMGLVELQDKLGFLDKEGNVAITIDLRGANGFSSGVACVKKSDYRTVYINKTGQKIFNKSFKDGRSFSEGLAAVCDENGKWGFIDKSGELVISNKFYNVKSDYYNGEAEIEEAPERVDKGDSYYEVTRRYIINKNGKILRESGKSWTALKKKGS